MTDLTLKLLVEAIGKSDIVDIYILMSMPEPHDQAFAFVKKEKINSISNIITNEIDNILLRELRHMLFSYYDPSNKELVKFGANLNQLNKIIRFLAKKFGDEESSKYFASEINLEELNKTFNTHISYENLINMFATKKYWDSGYGGQKWSHIAIFANELSKLKNNPTKFLTKLDRLVDFVHNNGTILNKFKGYQEAWLPFILDLKQNAINIRELIPYASKDIQKMFKDQAWRQMLHKIPGKGAATSFGSYEKLIPKYIDTVLGDNKLMDKAYAVVNIGNVVKKIGYDETVKIIRLSPKLKYLKGVENIMKEFIYGEGGFDTQTGISGDTKKLDDNLAIGTKAIDAAIKTHPEEETFFEHYLSKTDPDIVQESPDSVLVQHGDNEKDFTVLDYQSKNTITFMIIGDAVIYGTTKNQMHYKLNEKVLEVTKKFEGNLPRIIEELKRFKIFVFNPQKELFKYSFLKPLIKHFEDTRMSGDLDYGIRGIVSGRFWNIDDGYISFWEFRNHVRKQLDTVVKFVKHLGKDPKKVKWEAYVPKLKDEKLLSFDEYAFSKPKQSKEQRKEEEALRKRQLAMHLNAGMKKQMGVDIPMKQLNPDMTNAEYYDLTKVGESTNFKSYFTLFNEALGLSNFRYNIPKDPEERVYDFYYMSMVMNPEDVKKSVTSRILGGTPGLQKDPRGSALLGQEGERLDDLVSAVEDAQSKLLSFMKKDLLDATYFAVAAEFRHAWDNNKLDKLLKVAAKYNAGKQLKEYIMQHKYIEGVSPEKAIASKMSDDDPLKQLALRVRVYKNPLQTKTKEIKDPVTGEKITQEYIDDTQEFFSNNKGYITSYIAAKKAWKNNDIGFIEFAKILFDAPTDGIRWASMYGGPKWAEIADGWLRLYNAEKRRDLFVWIDHIFDLAHNTGTMLNKVMRYSKNGSWNWIQKALDYKRDAQKPLVQFLSRMSAPMKYLAQRVTYALTGERIDQSFFDKNAKVAISSNLGGKKKKAPEAEPSAPSAETKAADIYKAGSIFFTGKSPDVAGFKILYVGSSNKVYAEPVWSSTSRSFKKKFINPDFLKSDTKDNVLFIFITNLSDYTLSLVNIYNKKDYTENNKKTIVPMENVLNVGEPSLDTAFFTTLKPEDIGKKSEGKPSTSTESSNTNFTDKFAGAQFQLKNNTIMTVMLVTDAFVYASNAEFNDEALKAKGIHPPLDNAKKYIYAFDKDDSTLLNIMGTNFLIASSDITSKQNLKNLKNAIIGIELNVMNHVFHYAKSGKSVPSSQFDNIGFVAKDNLKEKYPTNAEDILKLPPQKEPNDNDFIEKYLKEGEWVKIAKKPELFKDVHVGDIGVITSTYVDQNGNKMGHIALQTGITQNLGKIIPVNLSSVKLINLLDQLPPQLKIKYEQGTYFVNGDAVEPDKSDEQGASQKSLKTFAAPKFSSTVIKHTGPAGKANIKSLILTSMYAPGYRSGYSGYFKIEPHGVKVLYFDPNVITPIKVKLKSFKPSKRPMYTNIGTKQYENVGVKKDKALVEDLKFVTGKGKSNNSPYPSNIIILKSGTIYNAVVKAYSTGAGPVICVDGPVRFVNCQIEANAIAVSENPQAKIILDKSTDASHNNHYKYTDIVENARTK